MGKTWTLFSLTLNPPNDENETRTYVQTSTPHQRFKVLTHLNEFQGTSGQSEVLNAQHRYTLVPARSQRKQTSVHIPFTTSLDSPATTGSGFRIPLLTDILDHDLVSFSKKKKSGMYCTIFLKR
ncbi:hypothetical protein AVEN_31303-1 [Araneus ventricosus]|uniref:Uncharacterized protein n=1 Tax=Araneus ventricosus TaxID=182803 RepID=A0A4Y2G6W9_ARAVE|nr:hypothetical protein AVEN_31303-1 [Araneus ventricosus]